MTVRKRTNPCLLLSVAVLSLCWARPARADFMYTFSADTSSVAGQTGSLDIQFNPNGPGGSDTVSITSFSNVGGTLGAASLIGDVTGTLAALPVTFTDDTPLNDLSQAFTFGSSLTFTVDLATNSASPGATLAFTMYDRFGNPVNAIVGNFDAAEIDVDPFGNPESPLTGSGVSQGSGGSVVTPEPSSAVLLAVGGFWLAVYRRLQRKRQRVGHLVRGWLDRPAIGH
jgi:hypothetical protein